METYENKLNAVCFTNGNCILKIYQKQMLQQQVDK